MAKKKIYKNSIKKREAIIDAALATFLEQGYGVATIDKIVAKAGGSKATIYKYFKDKEELFSTVVDKLVKHGQFSTTLNPEEDPEQALLNLAFIRLNVIFNAQHSSLRRLVIGESGRFPNIAKTYYTHGPEYSHKQLVKYFNEQNRRGVLKIDDADLAAEIFQGILTHPFYLKSLFSVTTEFSDASIKKHARKVVEKFLKLYRA